MNKQYELLKSLLMELFQLDQPDLDFGLYRVMHAKSAEITHFLEKDLLPQVRSAFDLYKTADKAELEKELSAVIAGVKTAGMNPDDSPRVKELRDRLKSEAVDIGALENEVYDHLFGFFRRYYSDGDFVAKRVYKPGVYAIPYEGEEVTLHWANKDQYYIKTSEYLRDYTFRLRPDDETNPMRVHFRLADAAEGEHDNVRTSEGKDRKFILSNSRESFHDFIETEDSGEGKELVIFFEYRPATLTDWPENERDEKENPPVQKDLNELAINRILTTTALEEWVHVLGRRDPTDKDPDRTVLQKHIWKYTEANTFDYFIHKNIETFLRRELDFYIKNEVMQLDDVENESAPRVEQYISKIKVIREIAGKIIDFLTQLEDFQKKLWLKKKFVVETQYCITLDLIPEKFYPEIAANKAQCEEWEKLFAIDEFKGDQTSLQYSFPPTLQFLQSQRMLPIDTAFFESAFTNQLLSSINELDESLSGILIHGENQQAARLIARCYEGRTKCIYLDPPYNTSEETFVYKNSYRHSSWLSMIADRVEDSIRLMQDDAVLIITIDDEEAYRLKMLLDHVFGPDRYIGTVVVQSNPRGRGINSFYATSHDYCLCYAVDPSIACIVDQPLTDDQAEAYQFSDVVSEFRLLPFRRSGGLSTPDDRPNSEFAFYYSPSEDRIVGIGAARLHAFPAPYEPDGIYALAFGSNTVEELDVEEFKKRMTSDTIEILPKDTVGRRRVWRWSDRTKILNGVTLGDFIVQEKSGVFSILLKDRIKEGRKPKTVWTDSRYDASSHGTNLLRDMFGERGTFGYPKSLHATRDAIYSVVGRDSEAHVLDLFGGSGTTGHAVIDLNRDDEGSRCFVLVEAERYFDSVMRPRILKAAYAPEWRDGKPCSHGAATSFLLKYLRLESYEDTLNNLESCRSNEQQLLLDTPDAQGTDGLKEQYILRYMLNVETRENQTLLNVNAFSDPTSYMLKVKRPGSDESRETNVDLLETFNWLIGLKVQHIAAPQTFSATFERDSEKRLQLKNRLKLDAEGPYWFRTVTGATPDGRRTLIIWRKLSDKQEQDNLVLEEWFTRQGYSSRDSEFDLIYVNGSNNLENLKSSDELWKVRLIEEDFHRLMFEVEGE